MKVTFKLMYKDMFCFAIFKLAFTSLNFLKADLYACQKWKMSKLNLVKVPQYLKYFKFSLQHIRPNFIL